MKKRLCYQVPTHRPLSSSLLWFTFRILSGNPQKELLRDLWVIPKPETLNLSSTRSPNGGFRFPELVTKETKTL